MKAKRHPIGTTLPTARSADHPESPEHNGRPGMSGRTWTQPDVLHGRHVTVGKAPTRGPKIVQPPPGGRPKPYAPNGGSHKPGRSKVTGGIPAGY